MSASAAMRVQVVAAPASLGRSCIGSFLRLSQPLTLGSPIEQLQPSSPIGNTIPFRMGDDTNRLASG